MRFSGPPPSVVYVPERAGGCVAQERELTAKRARERERRGKECANCCFESNKSAGGEGEEMATLKSKTLRWRLPETWLPVGPNVGQV